jgi:glycosyltransferase involved in cell wall biosynthesis
MTLKEELEILRGEPIQVFEGDPLDIPCIETSDAEKLCKNPVVSVRMITYNHEPYIRQAIEGVMMQQTDFEFELIIGEDCSQDKTREICFEYQKKYPDKIRVLWWHENVSKLGGNSRRVRARCRGEFIALCEGDDYWTDPHKLQKQVDVMRKHPNVGMCFTGSKILQHETGEWTKWDPKGTFKTGEIKGEDFVNWYIGKRKESIKKGEESIITATAFIRYSKYSEVLSKYEIFRWKLSLGDITLWLALSSFSNVFFLEETTSVYRRNNGGLCVQAKDKVFRDGLLVRLYFLASIWSNNCVKIPDLLKERFIIYWINQIAGKTRDTQIERTRLFLKTSISKYFLKSFRCRALFFFSKYGFFTKRLTPWLIRLFYFSKDMPHRIYYSIKNMYFKR